MTMDVSSLGIEVKSTGIKDASSALSGLGTAAANAETKVAKLTDTVERLLKLNVTATMQAWTTSMTAMANAMGAAGAGAQSYAMALTNGSNASQQAAAVTNNLNQQFNTQINILNSATSSVNNYAAATNRAAAEAGGFSARSGVMLNTLKAMTTAFLYYQSINLAKSIVESADEYTNLNAKMVVATGSQNNANVAMQDSFTIAQQLRTSYAATAELMARMQIIMSRTGNDYNTVKTTVTGLAAALHLYGATTGEASSAMLAYAHSASTGLVHMRTLNSLMTSAPLLLQAFQDATGKSGEELRKMSTQGQLTFEMLNKALQDATPKFLEQFDRIPLTFSGAMQRLENAWLQAMGKMGQDTGFNTSLGEAVRIIENMIPAIAQGLGNAFVTVIKWVDQNKDQLTEIGTQIVGLIDDVIALATKFGDWVHDVTGVDEHVSLIASAIFGVRLAIAAMQDAFQGVLGVILLVGPAIVETMLSPILILVLTVGLLAKAFGQLQLAGAWIAEQEGNTSKALAMRQNAADYAAFGQKLTGFTQATLDATSAATKLGYAWTTAASEGKSAIADLMNSADGAAKAAEDLKNRPIDFGTDGFQENAADLAKKKAAAEAAAAAAAGAKAAAAAQKETNKQAEAIASLNTEYEKLLATQQALGEGTAGVKVGPAQTEYLRLTNEIVAVQQKKGLLNEAQIERDLRTQLAQAAINAEVEKYNELELKMNEADTKAIDKQNTLTQTYKDQLDALVKRNAAFKNPNGKEDNTDSIMAKATSGRDSAQANLDNPNFIEGATTTEIENQQKLVKSYQDTIDVLAKLAVAQHINSQNTLTTEWDKMFDPKNTTKFTDAMTKGFGSAGKAVAGVSNALRTASENQEKLAAAQKIAAETDPGPLQDARQIQVANLAVQNQIENYANLAQAAQGFFKKGTDGYKVMGSVEKAFRIAEMAMAIENFIEKSGLMTAYTALFATESGVQVATAMTAGIGVAAAELPKQAAYGVSALAAALTLPPPASYVAFAVTAALLAGIGILVGSAMSSGSSVNAAQRQKTEGTGTVLGDASKQSESISNGISEMAKNSSIDLEYSSAMLSTLQNIQNALAGVASQILQGSTSLTGAGFQSSNSGTSAAQLGVVSAVVGTVLAGPLGGIIAGIGGVITAKITDTIDKFTGGLASKLVGNSTKTTLQDSGITSGAQSLNSVLANGLQASAYQDVQTKSKTLFGLVSSTKNSRDTTALDPTVQASFTDVIKSMVSEVTQAGVALGMSSDDIAKKLATVTVNLGDISLKGMTSDQIQKQLEAVFSAFGDTLTQTALGPMLSKFQQAGEGLLETATRVADGVNVASVELNKLGLTAINFSDIINTSGDVGAEIVRQSIELKEAGTGIGNIIQTMTGSAGDIGDTYTSLLKLRTSLQDLGIAKDITVDLLDAAGGMDAFQSALDDYKKDFFSASQQQAMNLSDVTAQFQALGLSIPSTKAGFVDLVNQLSAGGASGQALAAKVILLSGAFNDLYSTVDDSVSTATSDLTDAYNSQVDAINSTKTAFDGFATSLKAFKSSLMTGDLSTASGLQKYQAEKALYEQTQAAAMAGDQTALSQFQDVANAFLTASRDVNASGAQYTSDYNEVLTQTDALQQYTAGQSSVQDQQLTALNQQVSGLITVNSSVLTVAQAITNLQALIAQGLGTNGFSFGGTAVPTSYSGTDETTMPVTPTANGSHAAGLGYVPFDGYLAQLHKGERVLTAQEAKSYQQTGSSDSSVVAELQSLRAAVASLRDGQREQTAALGNALYDSNAQNADAIVQGQKDATKDATYNQRAKANLV